MKRIIALILCTMMITGAFVFQVNAAGSLVFSDDFSTGFAPRNWFNDSVSCKFTWDKENQTLNGYGDAPLLQSKFVPPYNKKWDKFYASIDVQVRTDDDRQELWPDLTYLRIWYRDQFETAEEGAVYYFSICVQTGEAVLTKEHTYHYKDASGITRENSFNNVIAGPVTIADPIEVGENAEWNNMGIRVSEGMIQCYFNETLILEKKASPEDEEVGGIALYSVDETVGSVPSGFLFWNHGNWVQLDNFEVWTDDYDFDYEIIYGDADGNGSLNLLDASAMMKHAAGWTSVIINPKASDVNGDSKVNLVDVGLVMKSIAKWDVVLGPTE